jgi:hypothetical protein
MEKYSFLVFNAYDTSYYEDMFGRATQYTTVPFEGKLAVDFLKLSNISPVSIEIIHIYSKC